MNTVQSGLIEEIEYGRILGPYTSSSAGTYVIVYTYFQDGTLKLRKQISYKKYIEEYDLGLHRYINHPLIELKTRKDKVGLEQKCLFCKSKILTKFCSESCRGKYKRFLKRNRRIDYHNQFVIKIKGLNDEDYFIIYDRFHPERKSVFIEKEKTKLVVVDDENDVVRYRLFYNEEDAVRVKLVPGYKKLFWITETAILISRRTFKVLSQTISKTGYYTHATKIGGRNGTNTCFKVHRLLAFTFIPNLQNKPHINHIDGNKLNNNLSNLEWVTAKENAIHAFEIGLSKPKIGTENNQAKLNDELVRYIRSMKGLISERKLAKELNVGRQNINRVLNNYSYRNVV